MMEFVEFSIEGFLSDLTLVVTAFTGMFFSPQTNKTLRCYDDEYWDDAQTDLNQFVAKNMDKYLELVQNRVDIETGRGDSKILLFALDRLHVRLLDMQLLRVDVNIPKYARTSP